MELRVLHYFLAVAREQNITAAAESLHLSQPTLSTQLKALEEELGKQLLVRGVKGSRKVTLTEAGVILRNRAEELFELVQKTEHEIALSGNTVAGDVYIGAGETQIVRLLAKTAKTLRDAHPDIRYHVFSGNAVSVLEQLDKGLLDFGLICGAVEDADTYESVPIPIKDRWGVLMRTDAELASKDCICAQDLQGKPLILSAQKSSVAPVTEWLQKGGGRLNIAATYNLLFNASLLTSEGLGYTLCLERLVDTGAGTNLCFKPLYPEITSSASLVWKKYRFFSKAAELFRQAFLDLLADMSA